MSAQILPPTTADIHPERFADNLVFASSRRVVIILLVAFLAVAFGLRVSGLGAESFGEDELNKLQTVEEYRTNGLTGKNGEHPFLMKGLQTVSMVACERLNAVFLSPGSQISEESALRFPVVLFGTFTTLLIFMFVSRLFGRSIGLLSAALWAVEPMAVGFDRVAKEDTLVLFFFLLTNLFWIRGQTEAERGNPRWRWFVPATAASFAALMASKYYPFLLASTGAYYGIFSKLPRWRWDVTKKGWVTFFAVMGVTFVILNPTIVLPDTWREMLKFSSENRIGHDSYEFMGHLYPNQMTAWLAGVPWTFYFVFIAVKTSLATLGLCLVGLPLMFKRRLGDGRFFVFFWAFFWLISYTFNGGKFTRYFTSAVPLVLIAAAVGFFFLVKWLTDKLKNARFAAAVQIVLFGALIAVPLFDSMAVTPHFRLFTNQLGGGTKAAGTYFPHDEFYDATTAEIVTEIAKTARPNAVIACETPALLEYYAGKIQRGDLVIVSLSDRSKVELLSEGDFVVAAGGRRYFSNAAYLDYLENSASPMAETVMGGILSARVYKLDASNSAGLRTLASR